MTKKEKVRFLKKWNKELSAIDYRIANKGEWQASKEIFNRISQIVYDIQEELEDLTGDHYIIEYGPE